MVSFQLHSIEVVMTKPVAGLDDVVCQFSPESKVDAVPVLHLYGRNSSGLGVCLKVHKIYPYFFVELEPDLLKSLVPYLNSMFSFNDCISLVI